MSVYSIEDEDDDGTWVKRRSSTTSGELQSQLDPDELHSLQERGQLLVGGGAAPLVRLSILRG